MPAAPAEVETVLQALAATPGRLSELSAGRGEARLRFRPAGEPWSPSDILAHLRACADVWGKSIAAMLQQSHPTLRYVSPRTWVRKTNYHELAFPASLQAFTLQREDLLRSLQSRPAADWERGASFTGATRGREQTVLSYAQRIAQHEREHLQQIASLLEHNE